MKITNLTANSSIYTSNVYLIRGEWNTLQDVNTLIDVGRDPAVIPAINRINTGVGKKKIARVVITHNHYDHASLVPKIKHRFSPQVYAFSKNVKGVDHILKNGQQIKLGDSVFEVIHTPFHTTDSVCLYNQENRILFSGDTPLFFDSSPSNVNPEFIQAFQKIVSKKIETVYGGHGPPITSNCNQRLARTLKKLTLAK